MRERTTWTRSAARMKQADPYLMNQDHVSLQPSADEYVIGDPSTFAEDIHPSKDTWEAEYAGGQVKRNEIGMAEMRKDTFNHPEKTAADHNLLLKKADLCIRTASLMVGAAGESAVEDQAVALMHMPDTDLINTFNRLANGGQDPVAAQQQTAAQQVNAQAVQAQQCLAQGDVQGAQGCMAQMTEMAQECLAQGDIATAQQCLAQAQQVKNAIDQAMGGQMMGGQMMGGQMMGGQQVGMFAGKLAQQKASEDKDADQGQGQGQQSQAKKKANQVQVAVQQAVQQAVAAIQANQGQTAGQQGMVAQAVGQAVAQAMAAIQAQQAPTAGQQVGGHMGGQQQIAQQQIAQQQIAQQGQVSFDAQADDVALADMLMMDPGYGDMSEMGIEMEPAPMDTGDMGMGLGPEDDVLMTLFAADQQKKQQSQEEESDEQQGQQQKKQAMARTASTRTVGTRPSQGVSRVGGGFGGNAGGDVNKLAALWPSAPDVSDAFR